MAGIIDTMFGVNGTVSGAIPPSPNDTNFTRINAMAIDNSNNIVAAGTIDYYNFTRYGITRILPNGQIDTTFGNNGYRNGSFYPNQDAQIYAVAIDSSNNVITGGYTNNDNYCLARFLPNGQLDTTFGTNSGYTYQNFYYNGIRLYSEIRSIILDSSNNVIALCNATKFSSGINRYTLAKFIANGQLDSTFGSSGYITAQVSSFKTESYQHAMDASKNIYVAGNCGSTNINNYYFITKHLPSGQIDTTFGTNGSIYNTFVNGAYVLIRSIILDRTNKLLISGRNGSGYVIARFLLDGQLDTTFGNGGVFLYSSPSNITALTTTLKIDGYNRIIHLTHGGAPGSGSDSFYELSRLSNSGQIDTTFGTQGFTSLPINSPDIWEDNTPLLIDNSNHIFVGGNKYLTTNPVYSVMFVSKYLTTDVLPVSNVCFPAGTPISTNQGNIPIEKLNPAIHTIRNKKIVAITRTVILDKFIVCFEKNALGNNIPSQKTYITKNHKVFYGGQMYKAHEFIEMFDKVYRKSYHGEVLYNVLLEDHNKMVVNNLICETLHPDNPLAKLYITLQKFSPDQQQIIIKEYNKRYMKHVR